MRRALAILLCCIFTGCNIGQRHDHHTLTGVWKSSSGAQLLLNNDGTFTATLLPADLFFADSYDSARNNGYFNGSGTWHIEKWTFQFPEINIEFSQTDNGKVVACLLYVGGSGFWEYSPPWNTLFKYTGEEGGERYEFKRQ